MKEDSYPTPADIPFIDWPTNLTERQVNVVVLLLFILLTIIAAWPVFSNLDGVIIGDDNDIYINPWADWWTAKALTDPNLSLWHTNYLFYPNGANLTYHSFSHLNTLVSLSLRPFLGPLPAYNLTIIINLILIGFSIFQLARYLTNSTIAAILAGLVFAFNSQILFQTSHPVTFSLWCFPWMTLYFIRAIRENNYRLAIVAALFVFLGAATGVLIIFFTGMWLALLLSYMFISAEFPRPPLKILLTFGTAAFILILPLLFPLLRDAVINQNSSFVLDIGYVLNTDMISIFIPNWFKLDQRSIYLGIVPLFLILYETRNVRKEGKLWFMLATLTFLIAIGPTPTISGQELGISFPWSKVLLPIIRHSYRLLLLFSFGWAMLTAYGWVSIEKRLQRWPNLTLLAGLLIGLFIYIDFTLAPFPNRPAIVSPFYTEYLDDVPDDVVLAILPHGRQEDKRYLYYQTLHEHPITGGVVSRSEQESFDFIYNTPILAAGAVGPDPDPIPENIPESFEQLSEFNIGYLILDKNLMSLTNGGIEQWRSAIPFEPVYEDNHVLVYKTRPE